MKSDIIKYACLSDHFNGLKMLNSLLQVYLRDKHCQMCLLFLSVEQVLSEDNFNLSWLKSSGIKLFPSMESDFLMKS